MGYRLSLECRQPRSSARYSTPLRGFEASEDPARNFSLGVLTSLCSASGWCLEPPLQALPQGTGRPPVACFRQVFHVKRSAWSTRWLWLPAIEVMGRPADWSLRALFTPSCSTRHRGPRPGPEHHLARRGLLVRSRGSGDITREHRRQTPQLLGPLLAPSRSSREIGGRCGINRAVGWTGQSGA